MSSEFGATNDSFANSHRDWELYSKRKKARETAGQEDVFQYDELPERFRIQVIHIWNSVLGVWRNLGVNLNGPPLQHIPNYFWRDIRDKTARQKGLLSLSEKAKNPQAECHDYLLKANTEDAIDLIETTFRFVDRIIRSVDQYERQRLRLDDPDYAIAELNHRFRENGIGYEFIDGEIIRIDSKYIHAQAVKPALHLLQNAGDGFTGPLQEFLDAHERYSKGEYKDAIFSACKSFESTLKAVCTVKGWPFDPHHDTAKSLLEKVFAEGLIPTYLQTEFTSLRSILESGVPTIRNKTSGHGQGAVPISIPGHFAAFVLHLTASNIVFLIECLKATK